VKGASGNDFGDHALEADVEYFHYISKGCHCWNKTRVVCRLRNDK
jgi:hypothetical protein